MELAVVTRTAPRDWRDESDATIATALDVLARQAAEIKAASRGR